MIHTEEIIRRRGLEKGGRAQKFVDSEVMRCCDPLTPFRSGYLKNDAWRIGTVIGSGIIKYSAKYAKRNYYENGGNGKEGLKRGGKRGRLWFARMKAMFMGVILNGLKQICRRQ